MCTTIPEKLFIARRHRANMAASLVLSLTQLPLLYHNKRVQHLCYYAEEKGAL